MDSTDLTALITIQRSTNDVSTAQQTSKQQTDDNSAEEARAAAKQFETLLIHNMLKSMRKTTLAENTSNQRALYDDMLDQSLAENMVKAGGIGIADQLMSQLQGEVNKISKTASPPSQVTASDNLKLRELAMSIQDTAAPHAPERAVQQTSNDGSATGNLSPMAMINRLWSHNHTPEQAPPFTSQGEFLSTLSPYAELTAQRLGTTTNAVLAIAALETGWGKHMLKDEKGIISNNFFGIKAAPSDTEFTRNTTTEYLNGRSQNIEARFKSYDSTADSLNGFANFLLENPRYSTALQHASNPERFLRELHQAGYATDPQYADKAIEVMQQVEQQTSTP